MGKRLKNASRVAVNVHLHVQRTLPGQRRVRGIERLHVHVAVPAGQVDEVLHGVWVAGLDCNRPISTVLDWHNMSLDAAEAKFSPKAAVPAPASSSPELSSRQKVLRSPAFIVLIALLLRLLVITAGHTYRITPRRDHFQFGWEMGRIARSLATGQGFSSPTDLYTGPSAWAPPVYPYILAGVFKLFGVYSNLSGWVILTFNSI